MILNADYHTHTRYSHGTGSVIDNARAALSMGLKTVAITDHGFSHPAYGMRRRKLDKMRADCAAASKETGVEVKLGIESNILGANGRIDVKEKDYEKLDMILAGVHRCVLYNGIPDAYKMLVCNWYAKTIKKNKPAEWLVKYNTKVYVEAIKKNPIDILTHTNYLFFADVKTVAEVCADYGTYFEINTKKYHLTEEEWQSVFDTKVNFIVDSDAHTPSRVGDISLFNKLVSEMDFPLDRIYNIEDRHPSFRFEEFKKRL